MKCLLNAWQLHEKQIARWLLKRTGDPQVVEDIMQDVFIKAMRNNKQFCHLDDSKSWLFKMVKNHYIDTLRKQVESESIDETIADDSLHSEPIVQMQKCLPRVMLKLGVNERDIIEKCDLQGMPQAEYAHQQQLSLPAVKSRLQRARKTLKSHLVTHCHVRQDNGYVSEFKSKYNQSE